MVETSLAQPGLVCVPDAIAPSARAAHFALTRDLLTKRARERQALPDGLAFRFDAGIVEDVARFVANERKCCPFLDFAITLSHEEGPLWLRMTGPAGTRELLEAELDLDRARGCC